ncbi:uncharacterized protein METZ01_LOCUS481102, partial [marine metagenome]
MLILLGLKATGAVDKKTARLQIARGLPENFALDLGGGLQVARLQPPAQINAPAHDAGIGAWDIGEHAVKFFAHICAQLHHFNAVSSEARAVLAQL